MMMGCSRRNFYASDPDSQRFFLGSSQLVIDLVSFLPLRGEVVARAQHNSSWNIRPFRDKITEMPDNLCNGV
jgi:hypothetical protein